MDDETEIPQRIARLTPLAEVLALIDAQVAVVSPREADLTAALGQVLASDVVAQSGLPASSRALRDGFAVSAEATADAGGYAPALLADPPVRVDVGDALPDGADAVAPLDAIAVQDGRYEALAAVTPGEGVLPAGGDVAAGTVLRRAGTRLRGIDVAVLTAAGIDQVSVRTPHIQVLRSRTGNDVVIDAAQALLADALAAEGATLSGETAGVTPDLSSGLRNTAADAVIVIGGTGSGRNDRSVNALARAGRVAVHGVALAPGETAAFGLVGTRPVLLLPGRLDAAVAVWLVLGRRMWARLTGCAEVLPPVKARLARKVTSTLGLAEVIPVRVSNGGVEPIASGYVPLSALTQADGWILIPADSEGYPPGTEVVVRPLP
jgi:molybdopterin biosynthesis enzyme